MDLIDTATLPPLPEKVQIDKHIPSGYIIKGYSLAFASMLFCETLPTM